MRKKTIVIKIIKADCVPKFKLSLEFSNGERKVVDFAPFLQANAHLPDVGKYMKVSNFKKFKIVDGDLIWGDFEMLFPIMDIYENKLLYRQENGRFGEAS